MTIVLEDEIAQRKGVCGVLYCPGGKLAAPSNVGKASLVARKGGALKHILPIKVTAFHFCYDDTRMQFLINTLRATAPQQYRLRFKVHLGSEIENEYKLLPYGIKIPALLQGAAKGDTSIHQDYLKQRFETDQRLDQQDMEEEARTNIIAMPRLTDVLIGRGQPFRDYVGTKLWDDAISKRLEQYVNAHHRFEKSEIAMSVVDEILKTGARILHRVETVGGWKALNFNTAKEKAAIAFRTKAKTLHNNIGNGASGTTAANGSSSNNKINLTADSFSTWIDAPVPVDDDTDHRVPSKRLRKEKDLCQTTYSVL